MYKQNQDVNAPKFFQVSANEKLDTNVTLSF